MQRATYLDVDADVVLGAAAVAPLPPRDLLDLRQRPRRLDALRVVPHVDEPVHVQRVVRLHPRHVRD